MRWNLILSNPADSVDLPRQDRRQIAVLNVEQARTFVRAISGHPYGSLLALALTTGMRPSEYLGLTWKDLDLDRGTVSVSHTLEWRKGGWYLFTGLRSLHKRCLDIVDQRIDIDVFDGLTVAFVLAIHAAAPGGLPNMDPVGGAVAGAAKAGRIHQGFQQ